MKTIVIAGRLIDGISDEIKTDQAVVIENGIITELTAMGQIGQPDVSGIRVIDASDKTVMPGLINGHCHLCFSASEQPIREALSDDELKFVMRSQQHSAEALASGVTTVRDCGSAGRTVLKLRDAINAGEIYGSRIVACGRAVTSTGGHCHFLGGETDGVVEMLRISRELLKEGADFIKVMVSGGNMTPGSGPNIIQFGPEELEIAAREAHMHGKYLSVHVHSLSSIEDAFLAGADIFDHCSWRMGDETAYDEQLVENMAEKGIYICPALGAPYRINPEEHFKDNIEKIKFWKSFPNQRFMLTRRMADAGIKIIAGDDAGCRMTKFCDYWKGLKLMEEKLEMKPMKVLQSATSVAAEAMGMDEKIGALRVGMEADILIVSGRPEEDLTSLKNPDFVLQKGELVAEKGRPILRNGR